METFTRAAENWLATHHGVITTAQLIANGVPRRRVERLARAGTLRRATPGVFVLPGSPATLHQRAAVLCATYRSGFVTGPTAGMLAGLRRMPQSSSLHFSVLHGRHVEPEPGVRWRQTTKLASHDRMTRADGIVVASWARLAFDLAADLGRLDHVSVGNQLLERRDVDADELARIAERLCHPGRRGSRRFLETLAARSIAPQQSHGEVTLLDALRRRGVPVEAQVSVVTPSGPQRLDLGVAAARWGVELDVHPEHRSLEGHRRDAERRRGTNDVDWQVEIVAELDLAEIGGIADELAASYRRRVQRLLPSVG